jgi:hypothetical protein
MTRASEKIDIGFTGNVYDGFNHAFMLYFPAFPDPNGAGERLFLI